MVVPDRIFTSPVPKVPFPSLAPRQFQTCFSGGALDRLQLKFGDLRKKSALPREALELVQMDPILLNFDSNPMHIPNENLKTQNKQNAHLLLV